MNHTNDLLDALLRSGARRSRAAAAPASPGPSCPSAELLAAYFERRLDAGERVRLEAHFVGCGHCQAVLAAMARADAPVVAERLHPPVPRRGTAKRRQWLVPAGVAVSAVLWWVMLRSEPPPPAPVPVPSTEAVSLASSASARTGEAVSESSGARSSAVPNRTAESGLPSAPSRVVHQQAEVVAARSAPVATSRNVSAPGRADSVKAVEPSALQTQLAREEPSDAGHILSPQQRLPLASSTRGLAVATPQVRVAEPSSAALEPLSTSEHVSFPSFSVSSEPVLAVSANPRIRWRVGSGGRIEFSRDGGHTWELQQSEVSVDLLAAHAPADSICWVVGRAGTVLRTTDARTWQKLSIPAAVDLVRIIARDDRAAIVITADGHAFATQDGGRSWQPTTTPPDPR
jgi:hypothetical protein